MPGPLLHRTELLVGPRAVAALAQSRVILLGVGGVGSWTAEALVRTGIGHLCIVDSDLICATNLNRQVQATRLNVGRAKVLEMAERLRAINPEAVIEAREEIYDEEHARSFDLGAYDYVLDAIDSLGCKVELIANSLAAGSRLFSAMGAACRLDPTRVRTGSFWQVRGCPLARQVRRRLRKRVGTEAGQPDFTCVYSDEQVPGYAVAPVCGTEACFCPRRAANRAQAHEWCSAKARINGSVVQVTGAFGLVLAGLVVQDVVRRTARADGQG